MARRSPGVADVTYSVEIDLGVTRKSVSYTLKHTEEPPNVLRWDLVRGDLMKQNKGAWTLASLEKGRTRATYAIDLKFGLLVPGSVSDFLAERSLPRMLNGFKARAEKLLREKS